MTASELQPRYPIGTVARRTGLSAHVLRAWERRYGVVEPTRGGAGERLYSEADVSRFRLLHRLTAAGHPIGRIARLPTAELAALAAEAGIAEPGGSGEPGEPGGAYVDEVFRWLMVIDAEGLHSTLSRAAVALSSRDFIDTVLVPVLAGVGDLWEEGRICPAHEHVLSVQVGRVLGRMADAMSTSRDAPGAVAVAPAGQRHEFGALLASIVAAEEGWRVTYLGPDLPAYDIATAVRLCRARVVMVSAVLDGEDSALPRELREIRDAVGGETHLLVGGRGAARHREELDSVGAIWIRDLKELRGVLQSLHSDGAA